MVGENTVTSVSPTKKVIEATPLLRERVDVEPGDVVGIAVDGHNKRTGIALVTSFATEEFWYANIEGQLPAMAGDCRLSDTSRVFESCTDAVPVISVSVDANNNDTGINK